MDFDQSLFERLFTDNNNDRPNNHPNPSPLITRLMLDTQYRMHPSISAFPSTGFYNNHLRTGIPYSARPLPTGG